MMIIHAMSLITDFPPAVSAVAGLALLGGADAAFGLLIWKNRGRWGGS